MALDLDRIRERLSSLDAVALLALLGAVAGFFSGAVILLFRLVVEGVLTLLLPGSAENFEGLPVLWQVSLPFIGAAVLAISFRFLNTEERRTGIALVMERFHLYQGAIGLRSLIIQYLGGALVLICGLSMGREGPAVHLGAASGSLLGRWSKLPNNSLRVLTACGCAAAISASFNTPIAGVIFAMEVVMMEYHVGTFIPVILASVVGALMTRAVYGHEVAFTVPPIELGSLLEMPFVIFCGMVIGCLAAALVFLSRQFMVRTQPLGVSWRFLLAGVITAGCGALAPEILGVGYDSVDAALAGTIPVIWLALIMMLKLLATSACVGAGMPAGVIGPTLFIGAMAGGLVGTLGSAVLPGDGADAQLYVMLGMAGMMSATLQAPLAALMALLELTFNPNVIFPGMLVVVISSLVASQVFRQQGIFHSLLDAQGISLHISALTHQLQRVGVVAVMKREFQRINRQVSMADALQILQKQPAWLLIDSDGVSTHFMPAAELALHITSLNIAPDAAQQQPLDLLEIPGSRDNVAPILISATLKEALDTMKRLNVSALYVHRQTAPAIYRTLGIVRKQDIEHYYEL